MNEGEINSGRRARNACRNCKQRKIRCSGAHPCGNCVHRRTECIFDEQGRKVVVSQKYLRRLQQAASRMETQPVENPTSTAGHTQSRPLETGSGSQFPRGRDTQPASLPNQALQTPTSIQLPDNIHLEASNPLASTSSAYLSDDNGRLRCLGESSTWSFTRKTLRLIHDHLQDQETPLTNIATNEESRAYPLSWGPRSLDDPGNFSDLPSPDHAIYLISGIKFYVGQLYHLFDESKFIEVLHEFYRSPAEVASAYKIWYVQFLTLLGLAKAVVIKPSRGSCVLPGSDLFLRAMSLLPDTPYLFSDALTAVETLCAISLYLQCADMRNSAYIYIGSALRMAMTFGLHRERPTNDWSPQATERCHRIWWTVYILDRTFSFSMGVPISIQDSDITTPMPQPEGPTGQPFLYFHVKLSNLISEVVNKVYGAEGRLQSSFLPCVHKVLESIASIASDLNACCPLSSDGSDGNVSRAAAHLHLLYHQAIMLAMHPLLLHLFHKKLQNREGDSEPRRAFSITTKALLKTCIDTCKNMTGVLHVLQQQGLLGGALPFDLDRAFASGFVSVMLSLIDPDEASQHPLYDRSCRLLDEFINHGSVPAQFRKSEIVLLQEMVHQWTSRASRGPPRVDEAEQQPPVPPQDHFGDAMPSVDEGGALYGLSPGQILSLAEIVDVGGSGWQDDVEWMDDDWLWAQSVRGEQL